MALRISPLEIENFIDRSVRLIGNVINHKTLQTLNRNLEILVFPDHLKNFNPNNCVELICIVTPDCTLKVEQLTDLGDFDLTLYEKFISYHQITNFREIF
eukprot:TRINITY_DN7187_c1_g1_i1.p1 TRINITY_DN7187_c1_g1~~TRINITY_DN7187_c1_g1_i1.p1  ORF type:complete len:117 (-),score=44.64 TRINITY_DN7187_c1_g1_i1:72-371(-)